MLRDAAVALVKGRLKRSADTALTNTVIDEMQFVQSVLEGGILLPDTGGILLPWFLVSEHLSAQTVPTEDRVPVPTGMLREYEEGALWCKATTDTDFGDPMKKGDYQELSQLLPGSGKPVAYSLDGDYFYLHPTPDVAYDLRIRVYIADTVLSTNVENRWLRNAPDLVIAETALIIAEKYLRDQSIVGGITRDIGQAKMRLKNAHIARETANREYVMGEV